MEGETGIVDVYLTNQQQLRDTIMSGECVEGVAQMFAPGSLWTALEAASSFISFRHVE